MVAIIYSIIITFCAAVLAIEIAYDSILSFKIKQLLFLDDVSKTMKALMRWEFYFKALGTASYILSPLVLSIIVVTNIWSWLVKLFNCPYCLSVHLSFWFLFITSYPQQSVTELCILSLLGIPSVHILEKWIMVNE